MTKNILLDELKKFTELSTKEFILPVKPQKGVETAERAVTVYKMRLPDSKIAKDMAPYIIHQTITGMDSQKSGQRPNSRVTVRSIFNVYCDNEQDGSLYLLELMERLRIDLLRHVVIGKQFELDLEEGVEMLVYPDDTAPFFAGEMVTVWKMPAVEREVRLT